jgi:hypothetical protein
MERCSIKGFSQKRRDRIQVNARLKCRQPTAHTGNLVVPQSRHSALSIVSTFSLQLGVQLPHQTSSI